MATQIKLRRDTAANWTSINPVLALGEPGIEIDTRKIKYGDGTTAWTSLAYSAGDANFSGNYTDLSNKPTIPNAQIQSDWTQSDNTLKDFIKNKPSIPAAQIQSDWTQSTNTALDFIKNKPTLVTNLDSLSDVTITSATSGQVLKYNGTAWINDTDSTGGGASTGNVTFDDNIIMGTGDEFGSAGLYLAPGNASIANSAVQYLRVRGGDAPTHIHLDTGNNEFYDQYFGDDGKFVRLDAGDFGNVTIGTQNPGNSFNWSFTSDGNLILADGNSVIQSIANSSLDPLNPNVSTMVLIPDPGYGSQALVLDPTATGHIHLRAPGANIDEPSANIFLGGEDSSFEVGYYDGAAPNVFVHSGGNTWTFGTDGILTFPGNLVIAGNANVSGTNLSLLQTTDNRPLMALSSGANGAVSSLWVEDIGNVGTSNIAAVYVNPTSGSKIVRIAVGQNGVGSGPNLWDFGTDGTLTLPAGGDIFYSTGNSVIPDVSGFVTGTPWTSEGYVTGTPWTTEGYLTTITNIFDQSLNTTNNVTFNSVITSNVHAVSGAPAIGAPTNAVGGAGSLLTISAGDGGIAATGINAGNGGNLTITAGDAGSDIGNPSWGNIGGNLILRGGNSSRPYHGSDVQIHSGDSLTSPGLISLHTGTNQWTFGKTGDLTLANNATIIAPADNDLTLVVTVEYNICTLLTGGSGYGGGGSSSAISGGSGTGMMVAYGYGLSGQVVNVSVTTPGTGYVDGDVLTMTAGSGATFVITRYNSAANPNTNTAPADWTFGTDGNITLPTNTSNINYANGTSILSGLGAGGASLPLSNGNSIINIASVDGNITLDVDGNVFTFGTGGNLTLPVGGDIVDSNNKSVIRIESPFSIKSADFSAIAGGRYGVNTTSVAVTATLPASPATGIAIYFADAGGAFASNNLIIARNGQTIMGSASDMTVNTNDQSFGLFYNGTTWRVY